MGFPKGAVTLGGMAKISYMHLFFMGVSFLVIAATSAFYRYTRMGLAMRACADDMVIAKSVGIRANRCVAVSWLAACVIGVVAGILLTSITGINFTMTWVAFKAIGVWIVGGLESLEGVLIVGPIMGVVEFLAAGYLDPLVGGSLGEVAPFLILLMVLFIRPFGVFGLKEIERV
jgi:branched-chain amino acid transport system permease protein